MLVPVPTRSTAQRLACVGQQRVGTARLAGLGAADLQHMAARWRAAEMGVVGDDAMHLGTREVQRIGDARHGGFGDMAQHVLHGMQQLDQGAGAPGMDGNGVLDGLALMGAECAAGSSGIEDGNGNDLPLCGWHGCPCWLSLWGAARSGPLALCLSCHFKACRASRQIQTDDCAIQSANEPPGSAAPAATGLADAAASAGLQHLANAPGLSQITRYLV